MDMYTALHIDPPSTAGVQAEANIVWFIYLVLPIGVSPYRLCALSRILAGTQVSDMAKEVGWLMMPTYTRFSAKL